MTDEECCLSSCHCHYLNNLFQLLMITLQMELTMSNTCKNNHGHNDREAIGHKLRQPGHNNERNYDLYCCISSRGSSRLWLKINRGTAEAT